MSSLKNAIIAIHETKIKTNRFLQPHQRKSPCTVCWRHLSRHTHSRKPSDQNSCQKKKIMTRPEIKNKNQMQKRKMNFTLVGKRRSLSARATSSLSSTKKRILSILTFEGEKTYRTLIGFKHIIQINTPHRRGGKRRKCGQIDHKSSRISVAKKRFIRPRWTLTFQLRGTEVNHLFTRK
jgi:hypothetical protein